MVTIVAQASEGINAPSFRAVLNLQTSSRTKDLRRQAKNTSPNHTLFETPVPAIRYEPSENGLGSTIRYGLKEARIKPGDSCLLARLCIRASAAGNQSNLSCQQRHGSLHKPRIHPRGAAR